MISLPYILSLSAAEVADRVPGQSLEERGVKQIMSEHADFNSIIPDIGTRYDLGISSFSPTSTREKTVNFVDYFDAGTSFFDTMICGLVATSAIGSKSVTKSNGNG